MSPSVKLKRVAECGQCGESDTEIMQVADSQGLVNQFCVQCEVCKSIGPFGETSGDAVDAWNKKQRNVKPVKGSDYVN